MTQSNQNELLNELLTYAKAVPSVQPRQMAKGLFVERYLPHFLANTEGLVKLWVEFAGGPHMPVELVEQGQVVATVPPLSPDPRIDVHNLYRPVSELLDLAWKESQRLPFNTMQIYSHLTDLLIPSEEVQEHHRHTWALFFQSLGVVLSEPVEAATHALPLQEDLPTTGYTDL